jgi:DNA polymerase-3 subunit epsilon
MALPNFAVVDVETSGLNARRHRVLQLAVVTVDADGTVLDEWDTFVKLRWPLGRVGPTHIHGITRPMLREAPRLDAVLDELAGRIGDSLFVAHNARFDGEFLLNAARRSRGDSSLPNLLERRLCTLRMSRRLDVDRVHSHRLVDLCERYDVTLDRPHEARSDALATAAVLPHLLRAHGVRNLDDLEPFLDRPRLPLRSRP